MRRFFARANRTLSLGWAASLLAGSFFVSALLGLLRDRLLIANFGIGKTLDAYYIAFSVPDFIFYLLISGALSVTFIPVLSRRLIGKDKSEAWELSSSLLNLLGLLTLGASIMIMIAAPLLVNIIAGGAEADVRDQAADLMRIVAVNPFLFGLASVLASMQQAVGRFFFNALAPVIYNLGIITGILVFAPSFGIRGVALGVGLGAMAQLIVQLAGTIGLGFDYRPRIDWRNKGLRRVLVTLPARSFDQSIDHLMAIVERFLASFLFAGAITSYQAAFTLRNVPITLIGAAIATAAFPKLSTLAAHASPDFSRNFVKIVRLMVWLALPAAVIAFLMRGYLVRLLLGSGSPVVAMLLGWLSLSIVFRVLFQIATRAFYAQQDTRTPLMTSIMAILLNILLAFVLVDRFGLAGLAMAQSAVAILEVTVLFVLLGKRWGRLLAAEFWFDMAKMIVSAIGMALVTYFSVARFFPLLARDTGFFVLAPKFLLILLISGTSYLVFSVILRLKETRPITGVLTRILFKPVRLPGS